MEGGGGRGRGCQKRAEQGGGGTGGPGGRGGGGQGGGGDGRAAGAAGAAAEDEQEGGRETAGAARVDDRSRGAGDEDGRWWLPASLQLPDRHRRPRPGRGRGRRGDGGLGPRAGAPDAEAHRQALSPIAAPPSRRR